MHAYETREEEDTHAKIWGKMFAYFKIESESANNEKSNEHQIETGFKPRAPDWARPIPLPFVNV